MAVRELPRTSIDPEDLSALQVLVVDANAHVVRLMTDVLRAGGVGRVQRAASAEIALDHLVGRAPDVVFTEMHLPGMDGLALVRTIRAAARTQDPRIARPDLPVIMVTGARREKDVRLAQQAGVNEFVIKPFTPASLLSRIQSVLRNPRPFVVSSAYVGPDRRRRLEVSYAGPLRRLSDPDEIADQMEREMTLRTVSIELAAMRRLIADRGQMDTSLHQMTYRVLRHTHIRAGQVRNQDLQAGAGRLIAFMETLGRPERCPPAAVLDQIDQLLGLLSPSTADADAAERMSRGLALAAHAKSGARHAAA